MHLEPSLQVLYIPHQPIRYKPALKRLQEVKSLPSFTLSIDVNKLPIWLAASYEVPITGTRAQ